MRPRVPIPSVRAIAGTPYGTSDALSGEPHAQYIKPFVPTVHSHDEKFMPLAP